MPGSLALGYGLDRTPCQLAEITRHRLKLSHLMLYLDHHIIFYIQWADLICKGSRCSRLRESPISNGQIDVLITRQHRADVFLDEVNGLGLGG